MPKLKVIFQGGGARLCTLLAAAHALEEVCSQRNIQIVEVGGVSAGSIAAAAIAGPLTSNEVRINLLKNKKDFKRRIERAAGRNRYPFLDEEQKLQSIIWHLLTLRFIWRPVVRIIKIIYYFFKIIVGGSIINQNYISKTLNNTFTNSGTPIKFSDCNNLTIFSSDLKKGESIAKNSDSIRHQDTLLGEILTKSASMPFVFAGHRTKDHEVDGGICGNLPAQYFLDSSDDDTKVLAFTFEEEQISLSGFAEFTLALLNSSISSSVREAKIQTGISGGAICKLPNNVGTFDFIRAIDEEMEENRFLRVSNDIQKQIDSSLSELFGIEGIKVLRTNRYVRDEVSSIFELIYRRYPIRKITSTKIMVDKRNRRGVTNYDERCYIDVIEPSNNQTSPTENRKIVACQVGLPFNLKSDIENLFIEVKDSKDNDIECKPYLSLNNHNEGNPRNRVIIFIKEDIPQDCFPLTIVTRFDGQVFEDYNSRRWDFFSTIAETAEDTGRQVWICLPEKSANEPVDLLDIPDTTKLDSIIEEAPSLEKRMQNWVSGERLSTSDVKRQIETYFRGALNINAIENCIAWSVPALKYQQSAGFFFEADQQDATIC